MDTTLTISGYAADAKTVGDKLAGKAESSEVTSIRNDLQSEIDRATDAESQLKEDLLHITNWEKTITQSFSVNDAKKLYIYADEGDIVSVTATTYGSGLRFSINYDDGTSDKNIALRNEFRCRATKKIIYIGIYSAVATDITVAKSKTQTYITNYYDKNAKISGYIANGNLSTGYYHSDYIPIAIGDTIIFNGYPSTFGTKVYGHFYNSEKDYVNRKSATLRDDGLYQIKLSPSDIGDSFDAGNLYYFNFNMTVNGADNAVCYINQMPDTNLEYGQHQPESAEFFNAQQKTYIGNSGGQPIAGKKIAYNGDSIAESRITAGNTYNGGAYAKMIADLTSGAYENRARGGGILASAPGDGGVTPARCIVSDVTNMADDADLICFEGGINDYWRQVPLGDYSESDYSSTLNTTTLCGALESIFRQAKAKWVGKPIVFVITHKIKSTVYVANSAGYTMMQAHEKMVGICKKYAIPYYDAFCESGLNAYDNVQNTNFLTSNSSGTPDGCHPNVKGYESYYVPQLIALFNSVMPRN